MQGESDKEAFAEMATLVRGFQLSKLLQVAVAFDLPDRIDNGPRAIAELAGECGARPDMLLRMCRALAAFGVFAVDDDGTLSHTPRSRSLRSDARPTLRYAAAYWSIPSLWAAWSHLEQTIRSGRPGFETVLGAPYFEYLESNPDEARIFDDYMSHSPDDRQRAVAEAYPFTGTVVDIGGGNGALVAAVLERHPSTRGVLFDQQSVVAGAGAVLANYAGRSEVRAGDFFETVPSDGDVYLLSQILHDWNDERCLTILRNCRASMQEQARLLIIERVLDSEGANPANYLADMHMMVLFPGAKERTLAEYADLLRQAGFAAPRLIPTRSAFSIVEARPAD